MQSHLVPGQSAIRQILRIAHQHLFGMSSARRSHGFPYPLCKGRPLHPWFGTHDIEVRYCLSRSGPTEHVVRDFAKLSGLGRRLASG